MTSQEQSAHHHRTRKGTERKKKVYIPEYNIIRRKKKIKHAHYSEKKAGLIRKKKKQRHDYASVFLGVADFFSVVAAFFRGALFLAAGLAVVLVTRPDLVLLTTLGWSTTAGALNHVSQLRARKTIEARNVQPSKPCEA